MNIVTHEQRKAFYLAQINLYRQKLKSLKASDPYFPIKRRTLLGHIDVYRYALLEIGVSNLQLFDNGKSQEE